jgi:aspartate/methionine/tyrosine aminotransferase
MVGISFRWRNFPERARDVFSVRRSEVLNELNRSRKKVIDLSPGELPRYKEDGFSNTFAYKHLTQVGKEGWGVYPSETQPHGLGHTKEDARVALREAICNFLENYREVGFTQDHIFLGHGVSGCFTIINNVLLDPGDETLNIEPSHFYGAGGLGGVPIFGGVLVASSSDPNNRWEPDLDELRSKVSKRTKYLIIDHPTNPCGVIYSDKTLKKIIDIAGEYDLPFIVDEMYQLTSFDGLKVKSVASLSGDVPTIITSSTSKFWMLPGWSLGYACFQDPEGKIKEIEETCMRLANYQGFATSRIPTPILVAAARTFSDERVIEYCLKANEIVQKRRDFSYKRLNEIEGISMPIKPEVTHYGLFRVDEIGKEGSRWSNENEFALDMLKEEGVLLRPASGMGPSAFGYCRFLLYRSIEDLTEAWNKLERFMKA